MKVKIILIWFFTISYAVYNLYWICFCHTMIMDPRDFLGGLNLFIVGPAIVITSVALMVKRYFRGRIGPALVTGICCCTVVGAWTFGGGAIHAAVEPHVFAAVVETNDRMAEEFMRQHPPGVQVDPTSFAYPCSSLYSVAWHDGKRLYVMIPSAPGPKATLIYVKSGDVPTDEDGHHILGKWYYANPRY